MTPSKESMEKANSFCTYWSVGKDTKALTALKRREFVVAELAELLDTTIRQEREAIAEMIDNSSADDWQTTCHGLATAIRKRGEVG